jgi:hypothetical protein
MRINDVVEAFNKALKKIKTEEKCNPFFVSTLNIDRKIGTIKEFTIRIFLVDQINNYRSVVLKKMFKCNCPEADIDGVVDLLSLEVIAELVLLFNKHKDDLITGNYELLVDMENGTK